jgi:hypothetical protein
MHGPSASPPADPDLLQVVAKIARLVDAENPTHVSQPAFDRMRTHVDAPPCPTARAIYMRLNRGGSSRLPWPDILELACDQTGRDQERALASAQRIAPLPHLSERYIDYALRVVAKELTPPVSAAASMPRRAAN